MDWLKKRLKFLHPQWIAFYLSGPGLMSDETTNPDEMKIRHEECSKNLRNSVLTFAGFAVVCWVALSKSDFDLLAAQSLVKIAFVGIEVTLDNFLAVAPITALILLIHGTVFRLRLNRLDYYVIPSKRISTLFNLTGGLARLATFFLHVLVPVALLLFLFVKTAPRESFQWNLPVFAVALIVVVAANLRSGRLDAVIKTVAVTIAGGLFVSAIFSPLEKGLREQILCWVRLDYREVDFREKDGVLRGGRFPCADFSAADFSGADLSSADLRRTAFIETTLTEAGLWGTNLESAVLYRANLAGADLRHANLTNANLTNANLAGANLMGAKLTAAQLQGADLTSANLRRADLTGANLTSANLTGADLRNARKASQDQLDSACIEKNGNRPTLPEGLNPPTNVCPED